MHDLVLGWSTHNGTQLPIHRAWQSKCCMTAEAGFPKYEMTYVCDFFFADGAIALPPSSAPSVPSTL